MTKNKRERFYSGVKQWDGVEGGWIGKTVGH